MSVPLRGYTRGQMEMAREDVVTVEFTLGLGEASMRAAVQVPAGAVTVTELLPILQGFTSRMVEDVSGQSAAAGHPISCRAGCGACCRQLVPISVFEAEALGEWVGSLPEGQQVELGARFHAALLALRDRGMLERLSPALWVAGSEAAKTLAIDYLAAGVACPFLVEESCGIHAIRPLICREYVVTSPAEFCAAPGVGQVMGVVMPMQPSGALRKLGAGQPGAPHGWLPLVLLFEWMKLGVEPGKGVVGTGPEVLYEVVAALG